jgi:hypothetical protein
VRVRKGMDPATLFLIFTVGGGPERTYVGHFPNKLACEQSLARMAERKADDVSHVRSVCLTSREFAPDWLKRGIIHIDTLDQKLRP